MTRAANKERGELALTLAGHEYGLRPSYEAIEAIEVVTGKGLLQLAREAVAGTLRLSEVAQVTCECMKAWGRATDDRDAAGSNAPRVAKLILDSDDGMASALGVIAGVLSLAATGGYTSSGEMKAATEKKTKAASAAA